MRAAVKLRRCCKGNWYSTTPPPPVLLVTVPLCPLYNPGNPRTTSSTARRQRCRSECGWHGAGTPRCRGEGHDGAEQPVPSLRCGGPNLPSQPPTTFPRAFSQPLWSLIISWKRFFNTCFIYDNGQSWGRKLAFFCSRFGFESRKRGGTRQQCQRVLSHPLATASSSPYLPTKCIHNYR